MYLLGIFVLLLVIIVAGTRVWLTAQFNPVENPDNAKS
jgi:hypothetical protein